MAPKQSKMMSGGSYPHVEGEEEVLDIVAGSHSEAGDSVHSSDGSESEASTDTEIEGEAYTEEQDDRNNPDRSPPNEPDASSSGAIASIPTEAETKTLKEMVAEYSDVDLEEEMKQAIADKDDARINDVLTKMKVRSVFYYQKRDELNKCFNKIKKERRDADRALKVKADKDEKKASVPSELTLNARFSGQTYPITVPRESTLKDIRNYLRMKYPSVFPSDKKFKKFLFSFREKSMNEHPRRTCLALEEGKGWKMADGDVIDISITGAGGAKRSSSSMIEKSVGGALGKDDKITKMKMECKLLLLQLSSLGVPDLQKNAPFLEEMSKNLGGNIIPNLIRQAPLDDLKALKNHLNASNNEQSRYDMIAKIFGKTVHEKNLEMKEFIRITETSLKTFFTASLWASYMGDNAKMSWENYRADVEAQIEALIEHRGSTSADGKGVGKGRASKSPREIPISGFSTFKPKSQGRGFNHMNLKAQGLGF